MPGKTKSQLRAELRTLRAARTAEGWVLVLVNLIRWGGIGWLAYCIYLAIDSLAGSTTFANIAVDILGDINVSITIAWSFAAGGCIYGWHQRKRRKDVVERLQNRITQYELRLDPKRSSSQLTRRGDTRIEDRI